MAYTYENFTTAAQNAGLLGGFSEDDLAIAKTNPEYGLSMLKLRQDAAGATTTEQKLLAQEAENQLRKSYGSFGSQTQGSFRYGNETEYQKLLKEATNYQPFSYDPASDISYGAYRKAYLREAERARQDTIAKASAASGGVPSSYAVTAANQAGNYYTGQLNDKLPALEQNAYQRYLSDYNAKLSALDAMSTDRNFDYNAYLQEYERQQQEWNNALTLYQMGQRTPEIMAILGLPEVPVYAGGGEEESGVSAGGGTGKKKYNVSLVNEATKIARAIGGVDGQTKAMDYLNDQTGGTVSAEANNAKANVKGVAQTAYYKKMLEAMKKK